MHYKSSIIMERRNAILLSGHLKTYKESFEEFVKLIVKPANADVFCLFKRNTSLKCRETREPDIHDEEENIKSCLGDHLKALVWVDEVETTETFIKLGEDILQTQWLPKYGDVCKRLEHWMSIKSTVDQYQRLSLACSLMNNYSRENNVHYERVLRARPDLLPLNGNKNWQLLQVGKNEIFLNPSNKYEFRDMLFVAEQETMTFICTRFPEKYLTYLPTNNNDLYLTILSPECQLMQFMIKEKKHEFYFAPFSPTCTFHMVNKRNMNTMLYPCVWPDHLPKQKMQLDERWQL